MKITKLVIKNLFGITEKELDGRSIEISGTNGVGKSSIIDAIRYALENKSNRDCIIRNGAEEGEIILETDGDLLINRKIRENQADYKNIRMNKKPIAKPEAYLNSIFSPLQLDPVEFTRMNKNDQNRAILNLIEFDWDLNYIESKFGEIPEGIDFDQHILKVLYDIQDDKSPYYLRRQDINREIRNNEDTAAKIAMSLPQGYNPKTWREYDINAKYNKLSEDKAFNDKILRAKLFMDSYNTKLENLQLNRDKSIQASKNQALNDKQAVDLQVREHKEAIAKLEAQINDLRRDIASADKLYENIDKSLEGQIKFANDMYEENKLKLDQDNQVAIEWANKTPINVADQEEELAYANEMRTYITEAERLNNIENSIGALKEKSQKLTNKIELARTLPAEILKTAKLPIKGLTIVDGEPRINRGKGALPINSLSEGEQLDLCVDVALSKSTNLEIILIDGIERLSKDNRERLYAKCKEKGLQFIATRTTDSEEMEIIYL